MTALSLDWTALDRRRGACPALSAPMLTGDGLLARIALTESITPAELAEICRLALQHGNGMIDISARGNLQVRGLDAISAPRLDADVRAMNLPLREGLAVEIPPLAGLDPAEHADPRPLAQAIVEAATTIQGLAPKMTIVVDGGGQIRLSNLLADIRLVAVSKAEWELLLGGTERSGRRINVLRETLVVDTVLDLLRKLSAMGPGARGRDLAGTSNPASSSGLPRGSTAFDTTGTLPALEPSPSMTAEHKATSPFDFFRLNDDLYAVGIGPAFGQARAEDLLDVCREASRLGLTALKPSLDHSLMFFGSRPACVAVQGFAGDQGFIIAAEDPRGQIAACSGSPACSSATIPTHRIAAEAAAECGELFDGSFKLHVSGCAKGCAHPQAAGIALCGTPAGVSWIVQGKAADLPFAFTSFADTNATLRRIAAFVGSERRADETSADCLARTELDRLAAAATGTP